jgi:glycosyltransferase involved in cell wall biosynthesis
VNRLSGRPSVGIVAHDAQEPGGMERQVRRIAGELARRGYQVTVFSSTWQPVHGVEWVRIWAPSRSIVRHIVFFLVGGWVVTRHRPQVLLLTGPIVPVKSEGIFVHFCHAAYRRRVGRRRPSRRHWLWMVNSWLSQGWALATEAFFYRPKWTKALIAVGDTVAAELRENYPAMSRSLHVVKNGVDVDHYTRPVEVDWRRQLGFSDYDSVLLFLGGDWERKGLAIALDALRFLDFSYRMVVVGQGDEMGWAKKAEELDVISRVMFVGQQLDPRPYLWAANVLIHPSSYEAMPLAILEAAAAGLPVVTSVVTDISVDLAAVGAARIVRNTGAHVAEGVIELLTGDVVGRKERARAVASRYSWASAVDSLEVHLLNNVGSPGAARHVTQGNSG